MGFGNQEYHKSSTGKTRSGFHACHEDRIIAGIVACLHGDEFIGNKVLDQLKDIVVLRGGIDYVIANKKAMMHNKRYMELDLNRCFPWQFRRKLRRKACFRTSS